PLPPYIHRAPTPADRERYQTVYATDDGSVAAPTAGLHFTTDLLDVLRRHGVAIATLDLHVGPGTFKPVETENPDAHPMHPEWYRLGAEAAETINSRRAAGGHVWAVGTTVVRTLETVADEAGRLRAASGDTRLFIRPPYAFRVVDRLITNFHLPRSTLLMLVCAFGGYEHVMTAYRAAVAAGYRFYSYGDAMALI
ncbi:MAG TPA: S-adenosylmethionine:tRNA ribosyltransferase-isomerase, partial [Gemmatimonadales bacterium]|nr:S-adenosylmethionine:tRNA ribosyltransferase-isomerase [Gemmatimonadales bacterium]